MPTTTALENTEAPPAHDALEINVPAETPNRRIAWTGAVSAAVHLLLLLTVGVATFESRRPNSAPELRLYVELEDQGRDEEHDRAGPVEAKQPAAPVEAPKERLLSAATPSRSTSVRSQPQTVAPAAPPSPVTAPAESSDSGTAESESPPEPAAVLTTTGESEREVPVSAAPAAPPPGIDIPAKQQAVLSRWVMNAVEKLQDANKSQGQLTLRHDGREYIATLERIPAADSMEIERVKVEIDTEQNGKRLRTRIEMKRLAFSHFAQIVDFWDPQVQFHDDEIVGRFHSNSRINVTYDRSVVPHFLSVVTTAAPGFNFGETRGHRRDDEIFRGGIQTRAGRIVLPKIRAPIPSNDGESSAQNRWFSRDTRITFYRDGTYGWREAGAEGPEQRAALSSPASLIGGRNVTLSVRGTVRGKVEVYSPECIVVEGNLLYAHDPRHTADADDYLGLISAKDVEIARPDVTGPGDLEIDGAVYARRRFVVTHDYAQPQGTLLIYGSLTAGSLSATEPRYATRYQFDPRLEEERPPGFPMTDRYEIEGWDEQWQDMGAEPEHELAGAGAPSTG